MYDARPRAGDGGADGVDRAHDQRLHHHVHRHQHLCARRPARARSAATRPAACRRMWGLRGRGRGGAERLDTLQRNGMGRRSGVAGHSDKAPKASMGKGRGDAAVRHSRRPSASKGIHAATRTWLSGCVVVQCTIAAAWSAHTHRLAAGMPRRGRPGATDARVAARDRLLRGVA